MARFPNLFTGGPATVSFTRERPAGVETLDALMARQRDLAQRQAQLSQGGYPGEGTIAGGLGNMVNQFFTGLQANRAREAEATGRQELAQAIAGVDPNTGIATPEQLSTVMARDPDLGLQLYNAAIQARAATRQAEQEARLRREDRSWSVEDREDQQAAQAEQARLAAERAAAKTAEERAYEASQPQTDIAKIKADADAGRISPEVAEAAISKATTISRPYSSAADRKALWAQQDEYIASSSSIGKLKRAQELLGEGIDIGPLAGARTWAGKAGLPGTDPALAARTTEYNNIMTGEAITAMSQALKGATTDTEMARFIEIMNDPATPAEVKRRELDTMLAKAQSFNELQAARIVELGGELPKPPKTAAPDEEAAIIDAARDAIKRGADPALVRKRMVEHGVDPGKL